MKQINNYILEKLIINKHSKVKQNSEFYLVWPKSFLHDLFVDYEEYEIVSSIPNFPSMLILPKDDIQFIDMEEIIISKVVVYDISPIYGNNIDKFKDDFTKGRISWSQIKEFPILTLEDIKKL